MSANRVVALLTPVFAGLAGWVASYVAEAFPGGPQLNETELTVLFVTGAVSVIAPALKWLDGWSKWEREALGHDAYAAAIGLPEAEKPDDGHWTPGHSSSSTS